MEVIYQLAETKTILLISHRLSNVVGADQIYMLKQGAIVEQGTHDQLIRMQGEYQRMYQSQTELESYSKKVV